MHTEKEMIIGNQETNDRMQEYICCFKTTSDRGLMSQNAGK